MKVKIEVDLDNDAFQLSFHAELLRVLHSAADKAEKQFYATKATHCTAPEPMHKLLDSNGNTVGSVELIDDEVAVEG